MLAVAPYPVLEGEDDAEDDGIITRKTKANLPAEAPSILW